MSSKSLKFPPIAALHRYWLWADKFRILFDNDFIKFINEHGTVKDWKPLDWVAYWFHGPGANMCHWYSSLFVVIEGWRGLKFSEPEIDEMLKSENVKHLKRFRHGTFHFQPDYFDTRFTEFMGQKDSVTWVRNLTAAFGKYFLTEIPKQSKSGRTNERTGG